MPNPVGLDKSGMGSNIAVDDPMPINKQEALSEEAKAVIRHADPSKANLAGRIFLGIVSVGLSEGIRAIAHHVRVGHSVDRMAAKLMGEDITAEQARKEFETVASTHPKTAFKVLAKFVKLAPVKASEVEGALLYSLPDGTFYDALDEDFKQASSKRQAMMLSVVAGSLKGAKNIVSFLDQLKSTKHNGRANNIVAHMVQQGYAKAVANILAVETEKPHVSHDIFNDVISFKSGKMVSYDKIVDVFTAIVKDSEDPKDLELAKDLFMHITHGSIEPVVLCMAREGKDKTALLANIFSASVKEDSFEGDIEYVYNILSDTINYAYNQNNKNFDQVQNEMENMLKNIFSKMTMTDNGRKIVNRIVPKLDKSGLVNMKKILNNI